VTDPHERIPPGVAVCWRPAGVLHVDLPDGRTLRCESVPAGVARAAALLDGTRSRQDAAAEAGISDDWIAWLLGAIAESGVSSGAPRAAVIEIRGCGALGASVARLLLSERTGVVLVDPRPSSASATAGWTRADDLQSLLLSEGHDRALVAVGHRPPCDQTTDLVLLLTQQAECDRAETDELLRNDRPHLVTSFVGTAASVGPLVVPGRTACLRCADLATAESDPTWPERLAVRIGRRVRLSAPVLSWVAATVVQQAFAWATHGTPDTLGTVLELDSTDGRLRTRRWPVHPDCGCLGS
jgi:hypothetical protein